LLGSAIHQNRPMHKGRVVRFGPKAAVLAPPFDDYTGKLLASVPKMEVGWLDGMLASRENSLTHDGNIF
jgi:peptide/nickel transport system ATP-binding protein